MKSVSKLFLCLLVIVPLTALAKGGPNNKGPQNNDVPNVDCALSDLTITSGGSTLSCVGPLAGNDEFNSDSWLGDLNVWTNDGVLTDTGGTTSDTWMRLAKYDPDSNIEDLGTFTEPTAANMTFSNCKKLEGNGSLTNVAGCNGEFTKADFTFSLPTLNNFVYDQIVFVIKASGYYSLYQVSILNNASELAGTLMTLDKKAISHLTMWVREGTPTMVSAPGGIAILLSGFVAMFAYRKKRLNP